MAKWLHIQQNLSMSNHPQTDRLSEQKNQWIEQSLQILTTLLPDTWPRWLALATAIHNNCKNETTSLSPNQILIGYDVPIMPQGVTITNNAMVEDQVQNFETYRKIATQLINNLTGTSPEESQIYRLGTEVWLDATHLKIVGASP
jgi:hypothetical protein